MAELSRLQRYKLGMIYDRIARAMPTEGRDYNVDVAFDGDTPQITLRALTKLGQCFIPIVKEELKLKE